MHYLPNQHSFGNTLFGPWQSHPLFKLLGEGQDLKRHKFREITCRAIQMGIYTATFVKTSQLVIPILNALNAELAPARILLHRILVVIPYASYLTSILTNNLDNSNAHQLALVSMTIHSLALAYLGAPLFGIGALFAFLATPILLRKMGADSATDFFACRDTSGNTVLHLAAAERRLEALEQIMQLLKEQPEGSSKKFLNSFNKLGLTALHLANTAEAVELLLNNEADPNMQADDAVGDTAVTLAIRSKNMDLINPLLKRGNINQVNKKGEAPLHVAILTNNWTAFNEVFIYYPNIDLKTKEDKTPLELALNYSWPMAKRLIEMHASIDSNSFTLKRVIKEALEKGENQRVNILLQLNVEANVELLGAAIDANHLEAVKYLINQKPHLALEEKIKPHFLEAKKKEFVDICALLVEKNPQIDKESDQEELEKAIKNQDKAKISSLLDKGVVLKSGSAIHFAVEHNKMEVVKYLLERDKSLANKLDHNGWSPLFYAILYEQIDCLNYLINHGANLEHRDKEGRTSLIKSTHNEKIMIILLEKGANPLAVDNDGYSFLDHFIQFNYSSKEELENIFAKVKFPKEMLQKTLASARKREHKDGWISFLEARIALGKFQSFDFSDPKLLLLFGKPIEDNLQKLKNALQESDEALVKELLKEVSLEEMNKDGNILADAILGKKPKEMLELLIDRGVPINSGIEQQKDALSLVAQQGLERALFDLLILKGAQFQPDNKNASYISYFHKVLSEAPLEVIKALLKNAKDGTAAGFAALCYFCGSESITRSDVIKWILDEKPELLNKGDDDGRSALFLALKNNKKVASLVLLEKQNVDITAVDKTAQTIFHHQNWMEEPFLLDRVLIKGGSWIYNYHDNIGDRPLERILKNNPAFNLPYVDQLIRYGFRLRPEQPFVKSAFEKAVKDKNVSLVCRLIQAGMGFQSLNEIQDDAFLDEVVAKMIPVINQGEHGNRPLDQILKHNSAFIWPCVGKLIKAGAKLTPHLQVAKPILESAIKDHQVELVFKLIEAGTCIDHLGNKGNQNIYFYAAQTSRQVLEKLLQDDPDKIKQKDAGGENLLHWAAWAGYIPVIDFLISKDRSLLDEKNNTGRTPFLEAKNPDIKMHLIFLGYKPSGPFTPLETDEKGNTAIHKAVLEGKYKDIQGLVESKGNIDIQNKDGDTPLHLAAKTLFWTKDTLNPWTLVASLLNLGAYYSLYVKNKDGDTPLHIAARAGLLLAVEEFRSTGGSLPLKEKNKQNRTPLMLAVEQGQYHVIPFLLPADSKISRLFILPAMQKIASHKIDDNRTIYDRPYGGEDWLNVIQKLNPRLPPCSYGQELLPEDNMLIMDWILELPFLCHDVVFAKNLFGFMDRTQFAKNMSYLENRYPKKMLQWLYDEREMFEKKIALHPNFYRSQEKSEMEKAPDYVTYEYSCEKLGRL